MKSHLIYGLFTQSMTNHKKGVCLFFHFTLSLQSTFYRIFPLIERLRDCSIETFRRQITKHNKLKNKKNNKFAQNFCHFEKIMEIFTTALSGVGISVVGLCLLRSWRSRSWASVSRVAHLADKTLTGQVSSKIFFHSNSNKKYRKSKYI